MSAPLYVQCYGDRCAWVAAQDGAWRTLAALARQRGCRVLTEYHDADDCDRHDQRTPLHVVACGSDPVDVLAGVEAVLPYTGADAWFMHRRYDAVLYTNDTPLDCLIEGGHAEALRRVLAHIGHHMVDASDEQRYTMLYTAVARYTDPRQPWCALRDPLFECVRVLIDAGADPHHIDAHGRMSIIDLVRAPVRGDDDEHADDDTAWTASDRQRLADVMGVDV